MRVDAVDSFEEQTIARHRVVNTRARQNQSIVTTKRRDHDRDRHDDRAAWSKHSLHHRGRDTILRRVLNSRKRQRHDVSEVREQIERHDQAAAEQQRARQILPGIAHFAGRERHVVPG